MSLRLFLFPILMAVLLVETASAQSPQPLGGGVGWSSFPVKFNIQWPTNAAEDQRYWFTNDIYHCQVFSNDGAFSTGSATLPRTEQRFEPDYTNGGAAPIGEIQYQSFEMVPSNENSYCVFQIHSGDAEEDAFGSTTFMFFWFTNNNGSLWDYSGKELVKNLGNKWFQVNVDHNLVNHTIRSWINQQLIWTQQDNGAGDFYFKDGCYEQDHNPTYEMDTYVTNILMWTNSGSPIVSLVWTGWTNGADDGTWDIGMDTNWVNATNRRLQFYQDAGTLTFNSSDPPGQAAEPFQLGGSPVTFDDSAPGTTMVDFPVLLQPASVTVSNSFRNYTFTGSGSIGGPAALLKEGSGALIDTLKNTYTGNTTINSGALALTGSASISNSPEIIIGVGTFDVSGLSSAFALGAGQAIGNSASPASINGNINTGSGTLSFNVPGFPPVLLTNGTLTLSSATGIKINNDGQPLSAGVYPLIEGAVTGNIGLVAGIAPVLPSVSGGGIVTGATASLQIGRNALDLIVTLPVPRITAITLFGMTLTITATNGGAGSRYALLASTNLSRPLNQWIPIWTNNFDAGGNLRLSTNLLNPSVSEFYLLSQ